MPLFSINFLGNYRVLISSINENNLFVEVLYDDRVINLETFHIPSSTIVNSIFPNNFFLKDGEWYEKSRIPCNIYFLFSEESPIELVINISNNNLTLKLFDKETSIIETTDLGGKNNG